MKVFVLFFWRWLLFELLDILNDGAVVVDVRDLFAPGDALLVLGEVTSPVLATRLHPRKCEPCKPPFQLRPLNLPTSQEGQVGRVHRAQQELVHLLLLLLG